MDAHDLSISFLEIKTKKDELRRLIDYDMKNELADLEKNQSLEGKLRVIRYKSEIQAMEQSYENANDELGKTERELKPILHEIDARVDNQLMTHIQDDSYIYTYLDDKGEIVVNGPYSKT